MQSLATRLEGLLLLAPDVHRDDRGFFVETFRSDALASLGIRDAFVQDNHSRSIRGTLRGMHFAVGHGQGKLVRVARGSILDVVVDIRLSSPMFGSHETFELDDVSHHQLWIPVGFAHGFFVSSEVADVCYRVTAYYDPALERGVAWNDPDIGIAWPDHDPLVSERDRSLPTLASIRAELPAW